MEKTMESNAKQLAEELMAGGMTVADITEELAYREETNVEEDEHNVGWNDELYSYSANDLYPVIEVMEQSQEG
jgi:hypothetical protein